MKKKKMVAILICVFLLVIIVLLAAVIALLLGRGKESKEPEAGGVYRMDESNYTQIKDEMSEVVGAGYFETYMTVDWTFPDGASEASEALLGNSPSNTKPIRCEILLADTKEKIFSTGVIPVGAQLPSIKLDVDLDAGKYDAVCMIYLLDETADGTYVEYSNAGFNMTITVEN